MFPLAHLGVTALLTTLFYLPLRVALVGSLLPDVVDKILFLLGVAPCGRFIGHTIFFVLVLSLLAFMVTKRKELSLALLIGSSLHLLLDAQHFMPWFYPFVYYEFPTRIEIEIGWFVILTESLGASILLVILRFNSKLLYLREKFWNLLEKMRFW